MTNEEIYSDIFYIKVSRKGKSRAKEITEIQYVTVTIQENTLDAGLAGVYDKDRVIVHIAYLAASG